MSILLALLACNPSADTDVLPTVPQLGFADTRTFTTIGTGADQLDVPRDLEFNPAAMEQLWTVNRATDSVVIYFDADTPDQTSEHRKDAYANHFMEEVSSLAFTDANTFATCQESRNTYDDQANPNDFMGPALWPANLDVFAEVNQGAFSSELGSHLDMLHGSPNCMGIAWHAGNAFWVFDGQNGHLVYYDFQEDHGPGGDDHSDGIVRRYKEVELTRLADVPGHMQVDHDTGWLYIADTGASRVIRMDTASGEVKRAGNDAMEPLAEYSIMEGAAFEVVVDSGLDEPSGLLLIDGTLFVSDHATGEIVAFDPDTGEELDRAATDAGGIMGLAEGPDGRIWYTDGALDEVVVLTP